MKRPHRRLHVLAWLGLAPVVLAATAVVLASRTADPRQRIPDALLDPAGAR